jgi:low affinity Fe/Cu permease
MNVPTRAEAQRASPNASRKRRAYGFFERFAARASRASGSSAGFVLAALAVVVWAISGPMFGFSQTWQLVINTGTTIVTFLMVFLIQHAQNKDSRAVHLKLNELIASHEYASNRLVAIEDLDEESLGKLHAFYCRLAELAEQEGGLKVSHSVDEAAQVHSRKKRARQAHAGGQRQETARHADASAEAAHAAARVARDAGEAAREASEAARNISDEAREAATAAVEAADATRRENGAHRQRGRSTRRENA